jgi:pseudaminic acid synthase
MKPIQIGERRIGPGEPCWIVAEVSANHNQSFQRAADIIRAAAAAGADAVKLQTYTADTLTLDSDREWFQISKDSLWAGRTLHQLYAEAYTPWEWHADLQAVAHAEGLECFSTPFDRTALELLERLEMPVHKVASFELVDIPLLKAVASTGKPVIASTGMATVEEIDEAVRTLRDNGARDVVLLKCTSAYPAAPADMHLLTIPDLASRFGVLSGLSDHTPGSAIAIAAVALGACVIEKHLTLRRSDGGPDSSFSMEPAEFAALVRDVRQAQAALGRVNYERTPDESKNLVFRRSLFVTRDIEAGEAFTLDNVRSVRPAHGLHTRHLEELIGKRAARRVERGTPLSWDDVEGSSKS